MPNVAEARIPEIMTEQLRFHPEWFTDPVPPWVLHTLDRAAVRELAVIRMHLQHTMLDAQLKANEQALQIVQRVK